MDDNKIRICSYHTSCLFMKNQRLYIGQRITHLLEMSIGWWGWIPWHIIHMRWWHIEKEEKRRNIYDRQEWANPDICDMCKKKWLKKNERKIPRTHIEERAKVIDDISWFEYFLTNIWTTNFVPAIVFPNVYEKKEKLTTNHL